MDDEELELQEFLDSRPKVERPLRQMQKPSPKEFFQTTYDWLKTIGKVGTSLLFFGIITLVGFLAGYKLIGVIGLFYILSIIIRIPDTYSDVFYFESIATFGLILTFVSSASVAIFFTLTAEWLTKFVSPFGIIEDYQETLSESVAVVIAIILMIFIPYGGNLLIYMVYFHLIRFAIFYLIIALTSPATLMHDLVNGVVIVPMSIIQSYFVLLLLAGWIFGMFGIAEFNLPSIMTLLK